MPNAPQITPINPCQGPANGGTSVTIAGNGFQAGATVKFGAANATAVAVPSATSITCTTPPNTAGPVAVQVINLDGQSATYPGGFTYQPGPSIATISPV